MIKHEIIKFIVLSLGVLMSFSSGVSATPKPAHTELFIGVISTKPEKRLKDHAPIAQYLAARLDRFGVKTGTVVVVKDIGAMQKLIRQNAVDIVLESALATIEMEKVGMVPTLLAWRKGVREYRTLFFVKAGSLIRGLGDLKGKSIAFEDPHSTSAYAIPMAEMKKNGLRPAPADEKRGPGRDGVAYSFAGEALNEAYWVIQERTDAAAFSNNDWDELPAKVRAELRIIHETQPIVRFIISFHPHVSGEMKQALVDVLLGMHESAEGLHALDSASEIKKVERLTDADLASLEYVRSLLKYLD
jgi:phosphonate transport system substrate-binding protein